MTQEEIITIAKHTIDTEISNMQLLSKQFSDQDFCQAFAQIANALSGCQGHIVLSGVGKSGLIGRKVSAVFNSIGVQSIFLHPVEAVHGDFGILRSNDILIALSCSGNTEEMHAVVNYCNNHNILTTSITCRQPSWLQSHCKINLTLKMQNEAIDGFPIPTTSCILTFAACDAFVAYLTKTKQLTRQQYGTYHCGGHIGAMINKN